MANKINELFNTKYPIIQGGMVWCSGWRLASAVSNAGGLGLLGAGSMTPEILAEHIHKTKNATDNPFGVNIPLLRKDIEEIIDVVLEHNVKIVFTSAGNPSIWTDNFKSNGILVAHVVANTKFALKSIEAGIDAIVAEGFEAGGHNGREETTTLSLIPLIREITDLPLIAAGGIYSGKTMLSAMVLGADGVQIGSRFAVAEESSAHQKFKEFVIKLNEGDTRLLLKKLIPVRLARNDFYNQVVEAEARGAGTKELLELLASGRSRRGIFEGDLINGELEIGQASAAIEKIEPAGKIIERIIIEYLQIFGNLKENSRFVF